MSSTDIGHQAAERGRQAADSRWVERLARIGLLARGAVYILIGVLAIQIAFGDRGEEASQQGALQKIADQPFGVFLLWIIALGFVGYGVWQGTEAAFGHHSEQGSKRTAKRLESAGKFVFYLVLAFGAASVAMGSSDTGQEESLTAKGLDAPGGQFIVGAVGVAIVVGSLILAWRGVKKDFAKELSLGSLSAATRTAIIRLGQVGYVARGAVFALFGVLVVAAAVTFDPEKARGIDGALQEVVSRPYGPVLLTIAALGLICFGVYSLVEARYRRL